MSEHYTQDIAGCLAATVGEGGLDESTWQTCLAATVPALGKLCAAHDDGSLPLLRLPGRDDDLSELRDVAERFRDAFGNVVVLGTGGSSLGGRALHALANPDEAVIRGRPEIRFFENIDPQSFEPAIDALVRGPAARDLGVIVISKSGSTAETALQAALLVDALRRAFGPNGVSERMVMVTEPRPSPLGRLADEFGIRRIDHDPDIGGRFAVLSAVGLLPAMIAGLDPVRIREGAASVLDPILAGAEDAPPAIGAAVSVGLARHRNQSATVLMPYSDRLATFSRWYRQLWAESLGKDGNGTVPIDALGAVDQHSQLQLYLDGPADKMYSLILTDCSGAGEPVADDLVALDGMSYLRGKTMGDLFDAEGRATAQTLIRGGRPTRVFRIGRPEEGSVGALMMHFMLETIVAADMLGVNPFDQPAVEDGKALAREYLLESR